MSLPNICDETSELCQEIFDLLNRIIGDYKNILKTRTTDNDILRHSGCAPILGWIDNRLSTVNISDAIHQKAIESHNDAREHYRDNYVWHAWLRNNSEYFTFNHDVSIQTGLPILNRVNHNISHNFSGSESLSYYNDKKDIERYKEAFFEFNNKYPIIGQIHRCLIIMRFFNESLSDQYVNEDMNLQKIYYPLFYFVNLFIHIGMLYYSFGIANYSAIIKRPIFENIFRIENYEQYININEEDYHLGSLQSATPNSFAAKSQDGLSTTVPPRKKARSIARFNNMKDTLLEILDKFHVIITPIYPKIKGLIETNITSITPIDKLDTPYFDAPKLVESLNISTTMGGPAPVRESTSRPRPQPARTQRSTSSPRKSPRTSPRTTPRTPSRSRPRSPTRNTRTISPRSKKKSNLKEMGFNERHINRAIKNNPSMSVNRLIDVIPNYQFLETQGRQDSPTPSTSSVGYAAVSGSSGASAARGSRNNRLNLTRAEIIGILSSYGITKTNTTFITDKMGIIIENLLSKIPRYNRSKLTLDDKLEIAQMYETMLYDYITDSYFEGKENDISHTPMNVVRDILRRRSLNIPNERTQRNIFSINALVKEILNIKVRN